MRAPRLAALWLVALATIVGSVASPGATQTALPDEREFFAEVRKRLSSNDQIQSRFSYRERGTELKMNPFGRIGTGPVEVYEVYPHPNEAMTYRRLVERDGRALAAEEIAVEDRRYQTRLARWQAGAAQEGLSERQARLRNAEQTKAEERAKAAEALTLFTFKIEGRETRDGQSAIVISFRPLPDGKPASREGRIARAFSGRAYIHEQSFELMHLDAKAIADVSFGYGLVGKLHKGSSVAFSRQPIDGVWLPAQTSFIGTGRALMLRKLVIDFSRTYYGYRPFDPSELPVRLGWTR